MRRGGGEEKKRSKRKEDQNEKEEKGGGEGRRRKEGVMWYLDRQWPRSPGHANRAGEYCEDPTDP